MSFGQAICEAPGCEEEFEKQSWNSRYHNEECKQLVKNINRRKSPTTTREIFGEAIASSLEIPEDHIAFLRREVTRLTAENLKLRSQKYEQVQALYEGMREGLSKVRFAELKPPKIKNTPGNEEVAAVILSDWQLGKVTPTYNTAVLEDRIERYGDEVIRLLNIQRSDHPVKNARVWVLGDMGEGEQIFSGQASLIESSSYAQFIVDLPRIAGNLLRRLLSTFESVHCVCVPGNHGRLGTKEVPYNKESNMDRIFYKVLEYMFAHEPRITFEITEGHGEMGFYAVDHVGKLGTLLMHGYQFPSIQSFNTMKARVLGYKAGAIPDTEWKQLWMGHYHQTMRLAFGPIIFNIAGSTESSNTWAQEHLAAVSRPSQPLQFIDPAKGIITSEATIWLD